MNPFVQFYNQIKSIATDSKGNKAERYKDVYKRMSHKLKENERYLVSQPAFNARFQHWNQRDIESIRPVTNANNPWIQFKRGVVSALNESALEQLVQKEILWLEANTHRLDWLND